MFREMVGAEWGVTGFVLHTVPAAVYCWARHRGDARSTITAAVRLGGDTDTVAAIAGALVGAEVGASGLPAAWVDGLCDWPLSVAHLRALAGAVAEQRMPPTQRWIAAVPRNMVLVAIIVGHLGLRALGR